MTCPEGWASRHARAALEQLADASNVEQSPHTRLTSAHNAIVHAGMALLAMRGCIPEAEHWEERAYEVVKAIGDAEGSSDLHSWYQHRYEPGVGYATSAAQVERAVDAARTDVHEALVQCERERRLD